MPPKKKRSTNFSERELQSLLDTIESILPIGSEEWDRVRNVHSIDFEEQQRTVESLRRKFRDLHLKKAPTGDPNMPATVRRAKEINLLIRQKSMVCIDCNETEEEEEDDEEGLDIRRDTQARALRSDSVLFDRTETESNSASVLSNSTEAEGNAIVRSSTVMAGSGLARRRVKRGAGTMDSYFELLMCQREEARREEQERIRQERMLRIEEERRRDEARETSERRHQEMMNMMMMIQASNMNQNNLASPSFSSSSRPSDNEREDGKRRSV